MPVIYIYINIYIYSTFEFIILFINDTVLYKYKPRQAKVMEIPT